MCEIMIPHHIQSLVSLYIYFYIIAPTPLRSQDRSRALTLLTGGREKKREREREKEKLASWQINQTLLIHDSISGKLSTHLSSVSIHLLKHNASSIVVMEVLCFFFICVFFDILHHCFPPSLFLLSFLYTFRFIIIFNVQKETTERNRALTRKQTNKYMYHTQKKAQTAA